MIQLKKYVGKACALALVGSFASQAFAVTTSGNGSACLPDDQNDVYVRESTGYTFTSGSSVHCPLVVSSTISEISDVDVFVDLPASTTATCTFVVRTFSGSLLNSDSGNTSSDTAGADIDLIDTGAAAFPIAAASNNSASLRCTMPAGGRIITYSFDD
jgi:hypothetical protein